MSATFGQTSTPLKEEWLSLSLYLAVSPSHERGTVRGQRAPHLASSARLPAPAATTLKPTAVDRHKNAVLVSLPLNSH